jgi:hypothetical protein
MRVLCRGIARWTTWAIAAVAATGCYDDAASCGCPDAGGFEKCDELSGLCWQNTTTGPATYDEATTYCAQLDLGGNNGWRLPTAEEFMEILGGCPAETSCLDDEMCTWCSESQRCMDIYENEMQYADLHWTATASESFQGDIEVFDLTVGCSGAVPKSDFHRLRCVREI